MVLGFCSLEKSNIYWVSTFASLDNGGARLLQIRAIRIRDSDEPTMVLDGLTL